MRFRKVYVFLLVCLVSVFGPILILAYGGTVRWGNPFGAESRFTLNPLLTLVVYFVLMAVSTVLAAHYSFLAVLKDRRMSRGSIVRKCYDLMCVSGVWYRIAPISGEAGWTIIEIELGERTRDLDGIQAYVSFSIDTQRHIRRVILDKNEWKWDTVVRKSEQWEGWIDVGFPSDGNEAKPVSVEVVCYPPSGKSIFLGRSERRKTLGGKGDGGWHW